LHFDNAEFSPPNFDIELNTYLLSVADPEQLPIDPELDPPVDYSGSSDLNPFFSLGLNLCLGQINRIRNILPIYLLAERQFGQHPA